ncbi:type II toxin-antitoxin system HipA family toxin [Paraburkholderia acidicola]|uniref:Type II toxin-antitoxin system HipA family toxin n=1 Tax=Paraburkholderia acidicola TaxID=1912599 RepID=A0ABV1LH00_9BURK
MTSERSYQEAFVWVWLPGATGPVVCGRLAAVGGQIVFNYGRSYLARNDAIALYDPELPLQAGTLPLPAGLSMPGCIRDAAPDAWGRRVIINRRFGAGGRQIDTAELDELTYLLESGSDRIGALDFQQSASTYVPRDAASASLDDLSNAVASVEQGVPLSPDLERALFHGSSIGGARPKAMITSHDRKYIAKFSSQSDIYSVVKAEYIAMRLAADAGIAAAPVSLQQVGGKDVLLIERFDRTRAAHGWQRRAMVSALTLLGLDEMMARYASYEDLATIVRHRFSEPKATLRELFARMLFNVLCGNTDDHARNHAAYWDGAALTLTPAYDICPQARAGNEATQAMLITGTERWSRIAVCLKAAPQFLLSTDDALALAARQIETIRDRWIAVCTEARLSEVDRHLLWRRQFLNPFAFVDAPAQLAEILLPAGD